jgi:hypothetical protein
MQSPGLPATRSAWSKWSVPPSRQEEAPDPESGGGSALDGSGSFTNHTLCNTCCRKEFMRGCIDRTSNHAAEPATVRSGGRSPRAPWKPVVVPTPERSIHRPLVGDRCPTRRLEAESGPERSFNFSTLWRSCGCNYCNYGLLRRRIQSAGLETPHSGSGSPSPRRSVADHLAQNLVDLACVGLRLQALIGRRGRPRSCGG